jgi:single-stranded DNA-binding protein
MAPPRGPLELVEEGRDERTHTAYVGIHIWGREGAVQAAALPPGTLVLVQGQVRPKTVKDQWTLVIAARELQLLDRMSKGKYDTSGDQDDETRRWTTPRPPHPSPRQF